MKPNQPNNMDEEQIRITTVAVLSEEEIIEFMNLEDNERAVKLVMESATATATKMIRENIESKREFWNNLLESRKLPLNGRYMVDIHKKEVMMQIDEELPMQGRVPPFPS
jgi:hypothetical protein